MKCFKKVLFQMLVLMSIYSLSAQSIVLPDQNFGVLCPITIEFDGASSDEGSWIGLYPVSGSDGEYLTYQYTLGSVSGELTFEGRTETGYFNFRMFSGNGYEKIGTSAPFLIRQGMVPDLSFGNGGIFTNDMLLNNLDDWAVDVGIGPNGKIIVCGAAKTGAISNGGVEIVEIIVARFNTSGQPDASFGQNGKVVTSVDALELTDVSVLLVHSDGKIIVGGSGYAAGGNCSFFASTVLIRFNENGTIDDTFGDAGRVITNFTQVNEPFGFSNDFLKSLTFQPDGKILAGGYGVLCDGSWSLGFRGNIARYFSNGTLDPSFGDGGKLIVFTSEVNYPSSYRERIDAIIPPENMEDGKIFAAVTSGDGNYVSNKYFTYKFNLDGSPDFSFGQNGVVVDSLPGLGNDQFVHSIKHGPDNFLYIMGCTSSDGGNIWLMKKDPITGLPVDDFGTNGFVLHELPLSCFVGDMGFFDNKIFVGHNTNLTNISVTVFDLNGQLDIASGTSLFEVMSDDVPVWSQVNAMTIQPDGKFLLVGSSYFNATLNDFMLVRLSANTEFFTQDSQTINLKTGWNGISTYLMPSNNSTEDIVSQIGQQFIALQDLTGVYVPGANLNTLPVWDFKNGYLMKLTEDVQLTIEGFTPNNKTINLNIGWNLISVLSDNPVGIATVFAENMPKVEIILEAAGIGVFWPMYEIQSIGNFIPGKSYLLKMSEPCTLTF